MRECICSSCRNLKGVIAEEADEMTYECTYGYPSDRCEECTLGECEEECGHYLSDEAEEELVTVHCKNCGKELKKAFKEDSEGEELCFECYFKN